MELLSDPAVWTALLTLTALEISLGVDNILFISILSDRLPPDQRGRARTIGLLLAMLMRIALLFSLDSVITAIGMTDTILIAVVAVKILALSFLLLIGMTLVADGFGQHIEKGYIYFAIAFSVFVEFLNLRLRAKTEPVHLHQQLYNEDVIATASHDRR